MTTGRHGSRRRSAALGRAFKDHPAVIGWQLDNEIEHKVNRVCYNPACQRAWRAWLVKTYGTAEEFNRRLLLESWGMKVTSLEKISLGSWRYESAAGGRIYTAEASQQTYRAGSGLRWRLTTTAS